MSRYVDLRIAPFNGVAGVYGVPAEGNEQLIASISTSTDDSLSDAPHYLSTHNPGIINIRKSLLGFGKNSVITTIFEDKRRDYIVELSLEAAQQRIGEAKNPCFIRE